MFKLTKKELIEINQGRKLTGKAKSLLNALFILRDKNGCCCKSYPQLMAMSGIGGRNTIPEKVEELSNFGVLLVENQYDARTNSKLANKYTLVSLRQLPRVSAPTLP